jgi:hypothetical protein
VNFFRLAAQKYTSLATPLKRAPGVLTSRGRRDKPTQTLNTPAQLLLAMKVENFMDGKGNKIDLNDPQRTDVRNDAINTGIKMADHT